MKNIIILCDDFKCGPYHRNVCFYYASLIFKYGFEQLGYNVSIIFHTDENINMHCHNNIVLTYPNNYKLLNNIDCSIILYNSECVLLDINQHIKNIIKDKRIKTVWDYTYKNINILNIKNHILMPLGYCPIKYYDLPHNNKDIDILFYGATNPIRHKRRYDIMSKLYNLKKNIVWVETFNDIDTKIKALSMSKIVLIIHAYKEDLPIDYFRMNELIHNKIFFIMETPQKEDIELYNKYKNYIIFSDYDNIINTTLFYLNKTENEREKIVNDLHLFYKENESIEKYIKNEMF